MRNRYIALLYLLATTFFLNSCEEADEETISYNAPVQLKFNLYADSAYQYTIKNQVNIEQEIDSENTTSINQNLTLTATYKVNAIQQQQTNVSVTYDRIALNIGNQLMSLDYDSQNDDGTISMYEELRKLIDKSYRINVAPTGKILSSEPVIKGNTDNAVGIDDSSLRKIMIHTLYLYPKHNVAVGDIWQHSYTTSVAFANLNVKSNFRLESIRDEVATIEMQSRLTSENTPQQKNAQVSLNGIQNGTYEIDVNTGLVISGRIKQELSGDMNITGDNNRTDITGNIYIMGVKKQMVPQH